MAHGYIDRPTAYQQNPMQEISGDIIKGYSNYAMPTAIAEPIEEKKKKGMGIKKHTTKKTNKKGGAIKKHRRVRFNHGGALYPA